MFGSISSNSGCYFRENEGFNLVMSSTGINDAPGVLNRDGVRNYVGGVPNPVDRDLEIRTDIQNSNNNVKVNFCCWYLLIVTNFILLDSPYFVLVLCKNPLQE